MRTPRWCVLWPIGLTAFPTIVSGHAVDQTPPQKPVADPVFEAQLPALDTVPAPATAAPPPPPPPPLVPDHDIAQPLAPIDQFDTTPPPAGAPIAADTSAPIRYQTEIKGLAGLRTDAPEGNLDREFRALSALIKDGRKAANAAQVQARADEDVQLAQRIMHGAGYFDAIATSTIDLVPGKPGDIRVTIVAPPGGRYLLNRIAVTGAPAEPAGLARSALGLKRGQPVDATLIEAVVLVFLVMLLFLQNWRATLIPTIAVPVVLLGTFAVLYALGFTINTLTLFGTVLAIGLLVDDAIVVVENVERLIDDEGLTPLQAAHQSMDEVSGALIGIGLVLSAVFAPMAFFGGSAGVIYRQFSITIVTSMALSVMVALTLTPALCAALLKPKDQTPRRDTGFFGWFNRKFDQTRDRYATVVERANRGRVRTMFVYVAIFAVMALLFVRLPGGFLPDEDQGLLFTQVVLPAGATAAQTEAAMNTVRNHYLVDEKANVDGVFSISGFSLGGVSQNVGICFMRLKDWDDRPGTKNSAQAIANRAIMTMAKAVPQAKVIAFAPPAVLELGNATGFDFELKDTGAHGHAALTNARNQLMGMAMQDKGLAQVRPNGLEDAPQLKVNVDLPRAAALGLAPADINDTLSTMLGGSYINDFIDRGRVKKVFAQADAPYRKQPEDVTALFVRGPNNSMAPVSAFASTSWIKGPMRLERYNGQPSMELQGMAAPGKSSGDAMNAMAALSHKLPPGFSYEWTGLSYEQVASSGQAVPLYILSLLIVFLCLAALYESWSVPIAVLLVVPLGVIGAVLAATLTGLDNDIYFQVGLITTVGLASKNAILIVEFAEERVNGGMDVVKAALEAASLRLRPILMTSLAFVFGVLPLAISTGPGSGGRHAIGRAVVGGMLSATVLAIFFVPVFFVLVKTLFKRAAPADDDGNDAVSSDPAQEA